MRISVLANNILIFMASVLFLSQPIPLTDGEDVDDFDDLDRGVALDKRMSKFDRRGKALNSFVRIGRNNPQSKLFNDVSGNGACDAIYESSMPDDYQNNQKVNSFDRLIASAEVVFRRLKQEILMEPILQSVQVRLF